MWRLAGRQQDLEESLTGEKEVHDFINHAGISNSPLEKGTNHRMVNIQFNSFIQGVGYYRCPPNLLSDEIFKGVLR